MQRVISHTEQRLCNGKNQEKNGTRFFFNDTVAGCNGAIVGRNGTVVGATGDK